MGPLSHLQCLLDDLVAVHVLHHEHKHLTGLALAVWPAQNPIQDHVAVVCVSLDQALFDDVGCLLVVGEHQNAFFAGAGLLDDFALVFAPVE